MARTLGTLTVVMLVVAVLLWGLTLAGLASLGREDPAGRGLATVFLVAWTIVLWLLLGALLVIGARTRTAPTWAGLAGLLLHPVSGAAAVAAVAMFGDRQPGWLVVVPALVPVLLGALALWQLVPAWQARVPVSTVATVVWTTVALVSVLPVAAPLTRARRAQAARAAVDTG